MLCGALWRGSHAPASLTRGGRQRCREVTSQSTTRVCCSGIPVLPCALWLVSMEGGDVRRAQEHTGHRARLRMHTRGQPLDQRAKNPKFLKTLKPGAHADLRREEALRREREGARVRHVCRDGLQTGHHRQRCTQGPRWRACRRACRCPGVCWRMRGRLGAPGGAGGIAHCLYMQISDAHHAYKAVSMHQSCCKIHRDTALQAIIKAVTGCGSRRRGPCTECSGSAPTRGDLVAACEKPRPCGRVARGADLRPGGRGAWKRPRAGQREPELRHLPGVEAARRRRCRPVRVHQRHHCWLGQLQVGQRVRQLRHARFIVHGERSLRVPPR